MLREDREILQCLSGVDIATQLPVHLHRAAQRFAGYLREQERIGKVLREGMFEQQLRFIDDKSRQKAALCGRRAGKTHTNARELIEAGLAHPNFIACYIIPLKRGAHDMIWRDLIEALEQSGIEHKRPDEDAGEIELSNRARLWVRGADDIRALSRFRGYKFSKIICDEASTYGPIFDRLVKESISPALADCGGQLILTGTPGPARVGLFWNATRGDAKAAKGWSVHRWTVRQNTRFPRWFNRYSGLDPSWNNLVEVVLQEERTLNEWTEQSPAYIREWEGRWIEDDAGLVYHYSRQRNGYDGTLPEGYRWQHVIGCDLGHDDAFALIVWAFCEDLPDLYQVHEFVQPGLDITECGDAIEEAQANWHPLATVADTGALGKQIVLELQRRRGLPIEAAEKSEKAAAIRIYNGDLRSGRMHILIDSVLESELSVLPWAAGQEDKAEDPRYANNASDASLYGQRKALHWLHRPKAERPPEGSTEAALQLADRLRRQAMREAAQRERDKLPPDRRFRR